MLSRIVHRHRSRSWRRNLSSFSSSHGDTEEIQYEELEQLKDIKDLAFYELHAKDRHYFYYIDLQGRLFLENSVPKNIATSLKSEKFLTFFFRQLKPTRGGSFPTSWARDYPFCSPCGKEMNFIKCADKPFVFQELQNNGDHWILTYGSGNQQQTFDPSALVMCEHKGRLYHPIVNKKIRSHAQEFGLIKSHLAIELGPHMEMVRDSQLCFRWQNQVYPIQTLDKQSSILF